MQSFKMLESFVNVMKCNHFIICSKSSSELIILQTFWKFNCMLDNVIISLHSCVVCD